MKKYTFFALLTCMLLCAPIRMWAGSDDEAFLEQVAKEYADMKGQLKSIVGVDVDVKHSADYHERTFDVNCELERAKYDDALSVSQIAAMVKFYYEDQSKQTLALEVLLLEKDHPGFLDAMIKTKSSYRVHSVLADSVYQYTGTLDAKELKQIKKVDSVGYTSLFLQKGAALFNKVLLPYRLQALLWSLLA